MTTTEGLGVSGQPDDTDMMIDASVMMGENPDKLAIAGDWHGNWAWATRAIKHASDNGADVIFHVGDFGFWTPCDETEHYLYVVEQACQDYLVRLYWIDGNHEDHTRRDEFNDPAERPFTTYVPRGYRWNWWGKRFMGVGGAFSIDRFMRKEGVSWWPEELLTDEEVKYACRDDGTPVDVVFSHDCPKGVSIPGIGPDSKPRGGVDMWPPDMLIGAASHRGRMRVIWDCTHPKLWVHGHYHVPYQSWYGPTRFWGLDCDGAPGGMDMNVTFITAEDLL